MIGDAMNENHIKIQLRKFGFYGLFKNLKFFDPFLWVYLASNGLDIAMIGILIAIREAIIYIFEIPSGVFADNFGRKTELIICFIFYIFSFILFFIGGSYVVFVFAFILFGFGEAFRSGTHKAMIMDFLDYHDIKDNKSKVYGLTRAYSMIGSTISSLLSVLFIIFLPNLNLLFLLSIVPYVIDLFLVSTYPNYLNLERENNIGFKDFLKGITTVVFYTLKENKVRTLLINSSMYNAIFKSVKDYIQPIIISFMMGVYLLESYNQEDNNRIMLGLIYAFIFLMSSITSKNSHRVLKFGKRRVVLYYIWAILSGVFIVIGSFLDVWIVVVALFTLIYVLQNIRKPLMVEQIGNSINKDLRASVLSVESQITSLIIIVLAPSLGFIYERFGAQYVFYTLSILSILFFVVERRSLKKDAN